MQSASVVKCPGELGAFPCVRRVVEVARGDSVSIWDGKYAYSIHPEIAWDVPAHIQMAIETYDWNPIPDDGGLVEHGTREERTTQYDWVRTWKLE